ncbi:hypothetical protein AYL99_08183 [Fonsecaea erecta]|uniref:Major facilitator superfamily (MFS) profile domain-containing protein n=1 Tax=Fonsecaea erecta TaxID=1367422 RepID=A0A178ZEG0_9EURO|nr:hypothetical protein AYL99_08183 [Fonsecaea erecta]OAP57445.1 hypothetical protein AYL99_08183 [Fonsecaea erecta]
MAHHTAEIPAELDLTPGTIFLEDDGSSAALHGVKRTGDGIVILHPQPSADPNDPLNWPRWQKCLNFAIVCYFTLIVFSILSVQTITWSALIEEFGYSITALSHSYALNLAGLALGCVFFIPLALMYGRKPVYVFTSVVLTAIVIGIANQKAIGDLYAQQVLSGLAGATSETLIQLTVADMFFVHQRGTMNGIYAVMVVTGNFVAPICAGFIVQSQGWRWVCWYNAIFMGIAALLFIFVYEDTKYISSSLRIIGQSATIQTSHQQEEPTLGEKGTNMTTSSIHGIERGSSNDARVDPPEIPRHGYLRRMRLYTMSPGTNPPMYLKHMARPFILMVRLPALAFVAFQYGILLCWIAILATTQATLFLYPPYNFDSRGIGLLSLAPFLGTALGSIWGGPLNDRYALWVAKRRKGIHEPEARLHGLVLPLITTPSGLLIYGISVAHGTHWIVPCIGSFCVGVGINSSAVILVTYYSDAYREVGRSVYRSVPSTLW